MESFEVCSAFPKTTWSMADRSTPALSIAPSAATTPRSVAVWFRSVPPNVPNGVRAAERKTTSSGLPWVDMVWFLGL
jgi:hypothetical protein